MVISMIWVFTALIVSITSSDNGVFLNVNLFFIWNKYGYSSQFKWSSYIWFIVIRLIFVKKRIWIYYN
jgi:hypothetical protein